MFPEKKCFYCIFQAVLSYVGFIPFLVAPFLVKLTKNEKSRCHFQAKCGFFIQKVNKQDSWNEPNNKYCKNCKNWLQMFSLWLSPKKYTLHRKKIIVLRIYNFVTKVFFWNILTVIRLCDDTKVNILGHGLRTHEGKIPIPNKYSWCGYKSWFFVDIIVE